MRRTIGPDLGPMDRGGSVLRTYGPDPRHCPFNGLRLNRTGPPLVANIMHRKATAPATIHGSLCFGSRLSVSNTPGLRIAHGDEVTRGLGEMFAWSTSQKPLVLWHFGACD